MKSANKVESFLTEVLQNLPEYSLSLHCFEFNYEDCSYSFADDEDNKHYHLTLSNFVKGYGILEKKWRDKKLFLYGIKTEEEWNDPGQWDAEAVDCLVQCSIFEDVIYG